MKQRTVEEIHNKEYGHSKFARFLDMAKSKNYSVTNIKEYNEKFKFEMEGYKLEFDKKPSISAKWQFEYCEMLIKQANELKMMKQSD